MTNNLKRNVVLSTHVSVQEFAHPLTDKTGSWGYLLKGRKYFLWMRLKGVSPSAP